MTKEKTTEFDLNQKVLQIDGTPELQRPDVRVVWFDTPKEVEFVQRNRQLKKTFVGGMVEMKSMTFRHLFCTALRNQNDQEVSIDDREKLIYKCIADKAEFDSTEKANLIKCVKSMKDPLYVMRTKQFFGDLPG